MPTAARFAYFTMEIGIDPAVPTYAGGLGVLAGDAFRAAADLELPMVGVTLLHRRGYFRQRLDASGAQTEEPWDWNVEERLEPLAARVKVELEGRPVSIRAWRHRVRGVTGAEIPVLFLDADCDENAPEDRRLTDWLYGGDEVYRLFQEAILGIGGVRMLEALGHRDVECFHLNEGHAALAAVELLARELEVDRSASPSVEAALERVRRRCVFTTHTPVAAGHDRFPAALVRRALGAERAALLEALGQDVALDMTELAVATSRFVNAVSHRHAEVARTMFPERPIRSITNGVHPATWIAAPLQALFDRRLAGWRRDAFRLRNAAVLPPSLLWDAHSRAKQMLLRHVNRLTSAGFTEDRFTLGFARRAASYKRALLIFHDLDQLREVARRAGPIQLVFAGKAHPRDGDGKEIIRRVHQAARALAGKVRVAYLPDHDMAASRLLCAGCDAWLNTPLPPFEASGTSGMKAALNGVPSLSTLDGWWIEGRVEGATGWGFGETRAATDRSREHVDGLHAEDLYRKLRDEVLPCFYRSRDRYLEIMRHAIALNGSHFSAHRMMLQYVQEAYRGPGPAAP